MIVVDSYGWIEYFSDGFFAEEYRKYLLDLSKVITPTIVLYEVYKKIKREFGEEKALLLSAQIKKSVIVPLNETIALSAADFSLKFSLPMADAIVYATSRVENCEVVTSNPHFKDLPGVILYLL